MPPYDLTQPWNHGVVNPQALPLINDDADTIRVEAGPGTGKTFGLVHRVQRLLHPDGLNEDGDTILVVAFNRVIAKDLEREILAGLEGVHPYGLVVDGSGRVYVADVRTYTRPGPSASSAC
jgi:hypothetical protein